MVMGAPTLWQCTELLKENLQQGSGARWGDGWFYTMISNA